MGNTNKNKKLGKVRGVCRNRGGYQGRGQSDDQRIK